MNHPIPNTDSAKPTSGRGFQFGLRGLLVITLTCGYLMGGVAWERRKNADNCRVFREFFNKGWVKVEPQMRPGWLLELIGDDPTKRVTQIGLSYATISDDSLKPLCKFSSLKELSLDVTDITDSGLDYLKSLRSLKSLSLADTRISDIGLVKISGMKQLKSLALNRTNISDAGLAHLKGLAHLTELDLKGTVITEDAVQALQSAIPNCKIYR